MNSQPPIYQNSEIPLPTSNKDSRQTFPRWAKIMLIILGLFLLIVLIFSFISKDNFPLGRSKELPEWVITPTITDVSSDPGTKKIDLREKLDAINSDLEEIDPLKDSLKMPSVELETGLDPEVL